jgi:energy-coupling factor transport system ATP-binding protein
MKLRVEGLTVRIGEKIVLSDVSFELDEGLHVVLGPNGAGKTTLLKSIACLLKPSSGRILIDDKDICSLPRREISKTVGYCWQNPLYGFFESTVRREIDFIVKNLGIKPREDVIKILGVEHLMEKSPFELSGGEAKRVSLASILVADQPVVLLDEPFEELDWEGMRAVETLVTKFREEGKLVVIAVNNPMLVEGLKPDSYVLVNSGTVVSFGPWHELSDEVLEANGIVPRGYLCRFC